MYEGKRLLSPGMASAVYQILAIPRIPPLPGESPWIARKVLEDLAEWYIGHNPTLKKPLVASLERLLGAELSRERGKLAASQPAYSPDKWAKLVAIWLVAHNGYDSSDGSYTPEKFTRQQRGTMRSEYADTLLPGFENYRAEREKQIRALIGLSYLESISGEDEDGDSLGWEELLEKRDNPSARDIVRSLIAREAREGLSPVDRALTILDEYLGDATFEGYRLRLHRLAIAAAAEGETSWTPSANLRRNRTAPSVRKARARAYSRLGRDHPLSGALDAVERALVQVGGGFHGITRRPRTIRRLCADKCGKRAGSGQLRCEVCRTGQKYPDGSLPELKRDVQERLGSVLPVGRAAENHRDAKTLTDLLLGLAEHYGDTLPRRHKSHRSGGNEPISWPKDSLLINGPDRRVVPFDGGKPLDWPKNRVKLWRFVPLDNGGFECRTVLVHLPTEAQDKEPPYYDGAFLSRWANHPILKWRKADEYFSEPPSTRLPFGTIELTYQEESNDVAHNQGVIWKDWRIHTFSCYPDGNRPESWYCAQNGGAPVYADSPRNLLAAIKRAERTKEKRAMMRG